MQVWQLTDGRRTLYHRQMFEKYGNPTYTCTVITEMLKMVAERNLCILCCYWYNVILSTATLFELTVRTVEVFHVISNEKGISPWSDFQNVAWILGPSTTTLWTFPSDLVLRCLVYLSKNGFLQSQKMITTPKSNADIGPDFWQLSTLIRPVSETCTTIHICGKWAHRLLLSTHSVGLGFWFLTLSTKVLVLVYIKQL